MKTEKKTNSLTYGFRKQLIIFSYFLIFFVLVSATVSFILVMKKYMTDTIVEKYAYINEKMMLQLKNSYKKSDDLTSEYVANPYVQKSLENQTLSKADLTALKKTLSYVTFADMSNLFYMDNKKNVYTRISIGFHADDFLNSELYQGLGNEYSKTQWSWQKDTLYQKKDKALFIGRYVRHMEYSHKSGVIMLKMSDTYFKNMLANIKKEANVTYLVLDGNDDVCYSECNGESISPENCQLRDDIASGLKENRNDASVIKIKNAMMFFEQDEDSGFTVAVYVPSSVLNAPLKQVYFSILIIAFVLCVIAILLSICFSMKFTKPVKQINKVMSEFNGSDFTKTLELHTNTELDSIGNTYNKMMVKIDILLKEIKQQEQELRYSELNSLMYQLNPHFLYNTLDNIYMLARLNKDERIMNMIQSLSKLLRISLNKGKDVVTLREELEHVCSYMDLLIMRNNKLFSYQIECDESLKDIKILKLILQPIIENCIKHGFSNVYEGGIIKIDIAANQSKMYHDNCKYLSISVFNNGRIMEKEVCKQINQMQYDDLYNITYYFPQSEGGYGIANVISRLRLKYKDKIKFYFVVSEEVVVGTTCNIVIPVDEELVF